MKRWLVLSLVSLAPAAFAEGTNALHFQSDLPDVGFSALRVLGALCLVLGLFMGAAWFYRKSHRLGWRASAEPRLRVLESRCLGGRHVLYVVGYDQQRLLIGSSPAGLNLLSPLPEAEASVPEAAPVPSEPRPFVQHLQRWLGTHPKPAVACERDQSGS